MSRQTISELETRGFALVSQAIDSQGIQTLCDCMRDYADLPGARRRTRNTYAVRHLLWDLPDLALCLNELGVNALATQLLGKTAFAISATFFDKNPDANWTVPGHQDLVMPVTERCRAEGFEGWSEKSGVTYVEPPPDALANLLALRIHLDDCSTENGALALVPQSHLGGKLRDAQVLEIHRDAYELCPARAGDVMAMKPLIVHRSAPSQSPSHRRVLHVVYATEDPGGGVRWKRANS